MNTFSFLSSFFKNIFFIFSLLIVSTVANAVATFTQGSTAQELADQIQGVGITITNPQITFGGNTQRGIFSNGINGANLEIDEGIILTTMSVAESFTTNSLPWSSVNNDDNDDADLMGINVNARFNTIVFEFDVTLDNRTRLLLIDYQFASEEYPEYVGSTFNDAFGFFISGGDLNATYNIARVVDNNTYVTIDDIDSFSAVTVNNVNSGVVGVFDDDTPEDLTNAAFFIDNNQNNAGATISPVIIEYDGLTRTLHATLDNLTPGETYQFKMAIADASDSQLNTAVFVNSINGLTEPSICYDYAYKQNGQFLTEGYDVDKGPFISGAVSTNSPIEVSMFFMNIEDSEIIADNVAINIIDINTSQATYIAESTWVTQPGDAFTTKINDTDLNASNSYINDIQISSFSSFEYFYTYFSLNPLVGELNLPITARLIYDLIIPLSASETTTIPRSSLIDADIPICDGGEFKPTYGLFNIIETGLYTDQSNYFYNLNTQVTNRQANLGVASIDGNLSVNSNLHTLTNEVITAVGIDMVDLGYQSLTASCSEINNTIISDRSWIIVDEDFITPFNTNDPNFYQNAREKVTLRISYNVNEDNGDLIQLEKVTEPGSDDRWNILNFSNDVQSGNCTPFMIGNLGNNDNVSLYCSYAGSSYDFAMTPQELAVCMECVFDISTISICARDNFSIRPEAFLITLSDQNQANPAAQVALTNGLSGVAEPINAQLDIAAGYAYNLEVNATNHLNNQASLGYNVPLNDTNGTGSGYIWNPNAGIIVNNCNDINDSNFTIPLADGVADMNTTISQVGEYTLRLLDTSWTRVDSVQQPHQIGIRYLQDFNGSTDCVLNSTYVGSVDEFDHFNGCNISSNHDTADDTNLSYNDLNLSIHPYRFDMNITASYGENNATVWPANPYIYMTDMNVSQIMNDHLMSFHLNGSIGAVGFNGATLSNFVGGCYAQPIDLTIDRNHTTVPIGSTFSYMFDNRDINDTNTIGYPIRADINQTALIINIAANDFTRDLNGSLNTLLYLNFDRDQTAAANPESIIYNGYRSDCNVPANCAMNADLNLHTTSGDLNLGPIVIQHYYARSNAMNYQYTENNQTAPIFYEVYCDGVVNGNACNLALLQNWPDSNSTDDPRWFVNTNHTANFGTAGNVNQRGFGVGLGPVTQGANLGDAPTGNHQDSVRLIYDEASGYPYSATMQMNSSPWLIFNRYNGGTIFNEFNVKYINTNQNWAGIKKTDATTKSDGTTQRTNRRTMW